MHLALRLVRPAIGVLALVSITVAKNASAATSAAPSHVPDRTLLRVLGISAAHLLEPARIGARFGVVTSGHRTTAHNSRVGGVANSHHLFGRALDVQRKPGVTHQMLDAALRRAGFRLIESIDEVDHSHFAFLPGLPVPAIHPKPVAAIAAVTNKPAPPRVLADNHGQLLLDSAMPSTTGVAGSN